MAITKLCNYVASPPKLAARQHAVAQVISYTLLSYFLSSNVINLAASA